MRAKRLLLRSYRSLRTTHPGFQSGRFDLSALRSVALYGPGFSRRNILRWIERCAAQGGWLVFHTHGVDAQPDRYGTRTEDLAWAPQECSARRAAHAARRPQPLTAARQRASDGGSPSSISRRSGSRAGFCRHCALMRASSGCCAR